MSWKAKWFYNFSMMTPFQNVIRRVVVSATLTFAMTLNAQVPGTAKWVQEDLLGTVDVEGIAMGEGVLFVQSFDWAAPLGGLVIRAVDPDTGEVRWVQSGDWSGGLVLGGGGQVITQGYGVGGARVLALSGDTGEELWGFQTDAQRLSQVSVGSDGTLFFGEKAGPDQPSRLYALTGEGGILKWQFLAAGSIYGAPSVGPDGTVYVLGGDRLYAIQGDSGIQKWQTEISNWTQDGSGHDHGPAIGPDGTLYLGAAWWINGAGGGAYNTKIMAMRPENGSVKWTAYVGGDGDSQPIVGPDGTVYMKSDGGGDDNMYAFNAANGSVKWVYPISGDGGDHMPVLGNDGVLYLPLYRGLVALNAATGSALWEYAPRIVGQGYEDYVSTDLLALDDQGTLYVGGTLALYTSSAGLATTGWPAWRHDNANTSNVNEVTGTGGGGSGGGVSAATAVASVTAGFVSSITVTSGGSGYVTAPNVTITGGGGSGATAIAVMDGGRVVQVVVTRAGSGYTSAPIVSFDQAKAEVALSLELEPVLRRPRITLQGASGTTLQIKRAASLSGSWEPWTNVVVEPAGVVLLDPEPGAARFYQAREIVPEPFPVANMVWIEPGTFMMGSPESELDRLADEAFHEVTLTQGYYMGKYEVTQQDYLAVMGNNPSYFKGEMNLPVEQVAWEEATNYCHLLTLQQWNNGSLPNGWQYRLPTEAQWEYACRAGTTTAFHYGNTLTAEMACIQGYFPYLDGIGHFYDPDGLLVESTVPVGSYAPNDKGIYDMHGNVFEWCLDWNDDYPAGPVTDPIGPDQGRHRSVRGGSWSYSAHNARSAFRISTMPTNRNYTLGFRPVLVQVP